MAVSQWLAGRELVVLGALVVLRALSHANAVRE